MRVPLDKCFPAGGRQPPGRYCLHLHLMHQCPRCVLLGNAVVNSTQVGITVHGTHGAQVSKNVLWNTMSAGVYVEDGNEMNNSISLGFGCISHIYLLQKSGQISSTHEFCSFFNVSNLSNRVSTQVSRRM